VTGGTATRLATLSRRAIWFRVPLPAGLGFFELFRFELGFDPLCLGHVPVHGSKIARPCRNARPQ
jgi:hypothetical protein